MTTNIKGMGELFKEVINAGLCAVCGACVGDCPYTVFYRGRISMTDFCTRTEGHCYEYCPRTHTVLDDISRMVFDAPYADSEIGIYKEILISRAKDKKIKNKGQYGGTVTALLTLALDEGLIDKSILARTNEDRLPEGAMASTAKELLGCAQLHGLPGAGGAQPHAQGQQGEAGYRAHALPVHSAGQDALLPA
jgi:coenzyme F420 hydrogenase subunit beta